MNETKLICNYIHYSNNVNNVNYKSESIDDDTLYSFRYCEAKLCGGSMIFDFKYNSQYEVVESDPEMEPEELLKIWRLLYE